MPTAAAAEGNAKCLAWQSRDSSANRVTVVTHSPARGSWQWDTGHSACLHGSTWGCQIAGSGCSYLQFLSNAFVWAWRHLGTHCMPGSAERERFKAKTTFIHSRNLQLHQPSVRTCCRPCDFGGQMVPPSPIRLACCMAQKW